MVSDRAEWIRWPVLVHSARTAEAAVAALLAARYLTMNGQRRLMGSFNHGSMANALARRLVMPYDKSCLCREIVVSLCLWTIWLSLRQLELPVKVMVFRNDALTFVELEMKAAGILDFATCTAVVLRPCM
jgi:pyruvate dehydrogenase (quinone)